MSSNSRLNAALQLVEQRFGQNTKLQNVTGIPTGSPSLDRALGIGGWPRGRISELWGGDSSGKTTLALCSSIECQRAGGSVLYVDAEHALDPVYTQKLGVNLNEGFAPLQQLASDQVFSAIEIMLENQAIDLVVIDSTSALYRDLQEGEGEAANNVANIMSQGLSRLAPKLSQANVAMLLISQKRWQEPKTSTATWREGPTGGSASRHYASVRVRIEKGRDLTRTEPDFTNADGQPRVQVLGAEHRLFVEKNKIGAPNTTAAFRLYGTKGMFRGWELGQLAYELGVLTRNGEAFNFGDRKVGDNATEVAFHLQANTQLYAEIYRAVMAVPYPEFELAL